VGAARARKSTVDLRTLLATTKLSNHAHAAVSRRPSPRVRDVRKKAPRTLAGHGDERRLMTEQIKTLGKEKAERLMQLARRAWEQVPRDTDYYTPGELSLGLLAQGFLEIDQPRVPGRFA
jgi:hypothetical protein